MRFKTITSPHAQRGNNVGFVMRQVLYALVPGTLALFWVFGWGVLVQLGLAIAVALLAEAAMLLARGRPVGQHLGDYSAVVTAWLFALCIPTLAPWWLTTLGIGFAIVVAKHLYGGIGYNPFNPAMIGYVALLISFPTHMTSWLAPNVLAEAQPNLSETLRIIFTGQLPAGLSWDSLTMATPLDHVKTQLGLNHTLGEIRDSSPLFGFFGGRGWELVTAGFTLGGLWLLGRQIIAWQIPAGMLGALMVISTLFMLIDPDSYPGPGFQLFTGAAIFGAFFIATDPVSASTTPLGRFLFGAGIGLLIYVIRSWGGYPDGVAFAVLLMNMAAPTIDYFTKPRVFGTQGGGH